MCANHRGLPATEKNGLQGFGHSYGHLKHKNSYALYTKLNAEKVMFGGVSNSCMGKKKFIFTRLLQMTIDRASC